MICSSFTPLKIGERIFIETDIHDNIVSSQPAVVLKQSNFTEYKNFLQTSGSTYPSERLNPNKYFYHISTD